MQPVAMYSTGVFATATAAAAAMAAMIKLATKKLLPK